MKKFPDLTENMIRALEVCGGKYGHKYPYQIEKVEKEAAEYGWDISAWTLEQKSMLHEWWEYPPKLPCSKAPFPYRLDRALSSLLSHIHRPHIVLDIAKDGVCKGKMGDGKIVSWNESNPYELTAL